jgi:acyl carrier protein
LDKFGFAKATSKQAKSHLMAENFTLACKLSAAAVGHIPSHPFLKGEANLDYGTANSNIARTAQLLCDKGLSDRDRIAVISRDQSAVSALYLASLWAGVCVVVLDPGSSVSELLVLLQHAKPKLVFVDQGIAETTAHLTQSEGPEVIVIAPKVTKTAFGLLLRRKAKDVDANYPGCLEGLKAMPSPLEVSDGSAALLLYTSGTSSQPKGVLLSRAAIVAQMDIFMRRFELDAGSRVVNHLPFHHTDGLNQGPLMLYWVGGTHLVPPPVNLQSVGAVLDMVYQTDATHLITVPTVLSMIDRLSEDYDDSFLAGSFKFLESTAGPISTDLWLQIETRFKVRIVNCYGLTETVSEALFCGPDDAFYRRGTIGKPDGFEVRLFDAEQGETETGPGELQLRGPGLLMGYFENPEATEQTFSEDGWFKTGDIATRDADGFYTISGRLKNIIIRASVNIYPDDLNQAATSSDIVMEAATIGMPDPALGERVVMFAKTVDGKDADLRQQIFEHLRDVLSDEKLPNDVIIVPQIPYGPSGKPELQKLQAMLLQNTGDTAGKSVANMVSQQAALAFRIAEDELDVTANSDAVTGWDSLSFLEFIMRVERRFDVKIAPRDVMRIKSVQDVIDMMESTDRV